MARSEHGPGQAHLSESAEEFPPFARPLHARFGTIDSRLSVPEPAGISVLYRSTQPSAQSVLRSLEATAGENERLQLQRLHYPQSANIQSASCKVLLRSARGCSPRDRLCRK